MMQKYVQGGLESEDRHIDGIIALTDSIGAEFENAWKPNTPK